MTRIRIITAAAICIAAACSDHSGPSATEPTVAPQPSQPTPSLATLTGRVIVESEGTSRSVVLKTDNGDRILLVGGEVAMLASVDGADVVVRGTWDAKPGLVVSDFEVFAMNGLPALDGVLMLTADGCALRLANGSIRLLGETPESIMIYHGSRLWVIGFDDEGALEFGVIADS